MDRRTALKAFAAVCLAPFAGLMPRKAKARTMTIEVVADCSKFEAQMRKALSDADAADAALNKPPIKGVPGETYFLAAAHPFNNPHSWTQVHPHGKLYFNGEDVTCRTSEVDLVGGWGVMFDMKDATHKAFPIRASVHHGKFEIRDPMTLCDKVTRDDCVYYVRVGTVTGLTV